MTSSVTLITTGVDLTSTWDKIYLQIPTHASAGTIYVQASDSLAGSYYRVGIPNGVNVADAQFLSPNGGLMQLPGGLQFVKVECTSAITDAVTVFKFFVA